jgi:hypothetical protein
MRLPAALVLIVGSLQSRTAAADPQLGAAAGAGWIHAAEIDDDEPLLGPAVGLRASFDAPGSTRLAVTLDAHATTHLYGDGSFVAHVVETVGVEHRAAPRLRLGGGVGLAQLLARDARGEGFADLGLAARLQATVALLRGSSGLDLTATLAIGDHGPVLVTSGALLLVLAW